MKKPCSLPLLLTGALLISAPAMAATASEVFRDVPPDHWAEKGVEDMAVKRDLMRGYEDSTFRGELPFTRIQFALVLDGLIREIERISKTSLEVKDAPISFYPDVTVPREREVVLRLSNRYRLFEGIPGIQSMAFHGEKNINRYEVAHAINNLLHLAERKGILRPSETPETHQFCDVAPDDPTFQEIQEIANRYGVMIGFPDASFRGGEDLTRYQFAMTACKTVPLICELVKRSVDQRTREENGFSCDPDLELALREGPTSGYGTVVPSLSLRWSAPWSILSDTRLQFQSGTVTEIKDRGGFALDERLGFVLPGLDWSPLQFRPMLGMQFFGDFGGNSAYYLGPTFGFRGQSQIAPRWRIVSDIMGSNILWGQSYKGTAALTPPVAEFLGRCDLDVQYALSRDVALVGGLCYWEVPIGIRGYAAVGQAYVTELKLGVAYAF
ncbi:MAG: S-layer homology domain-containing protein [Bacteroidota bacterium]